MMVRLDGLSGKKKHLFNHFDVDIISFNIERQIIDEGLDNLKDYLIKLNDKYSFKISIKLPAGDLDRSVIIISSYFIDNTFYEISFYSGIMNQEFQGMLNPKNNYIIYGLEANDDNEPREQLLEDMSAFTNSNFVFNISLLNEFIQDPWIVLTEIMTIPPPKGNFDEGLKLEDIKFLSLAHPVFLSSSAWDVSTIHKMLSHAPGLYGVTITIEDESKFTDVELVEKVNSLVKAIREFQ